MSTTLIYNATVWRWGEVNSDFSVTTEESLGRAEPNCFVSTKNGYIVEVSEPNQSLPPFEAFGTVVDAKGHLLIPGLIDSHIHVAILGESQYFVDLVDCYSIASLKDKVGAHIAKYPDLPWVIGVNWDQTNLGAFPHRTDIDEIDTSKPIFLWRACWHIGLANTAALKLAHIVDAPEGKEAKSPPGGVIEVDASGVPTGIIKERATELIAAAQQNHSGGEEDVEARAVALEQKMRFIREGMALCARVGLTSVHTNDERSLEAYRTLQSQQALPLRIFLTPVHNEIHLDPTAQCGIQGIHPFRPRSLENTPYVHSDAETKTVGDDAMGMESRLIMERVKIFTDGSLGAETAAIRSLTTENETSSTDPAPDATTTGSSGVKGVLVYERAALSQMLLDAFLTGYRVEIHAIGDAAAEQVLDALDDSEGLIEHALASRGADQSVLAMVPPGRVHEAQRRHWRPILTHCQVLGADLIERMAEKGIIANVQPSFVPTDMKWVQARIGARQLEYSYVWKTLLLHSHTKSAMGAFRPQDAALYVAGGSDAPIESPNPFTGIYDAMFRTNKRRLNAAQGDNEIVFKPEECLSFSQALWIYTIGGAFASATEQRLGQIAPGFVADLVLLDPAVLSDPERLHGLLPNVVFVGGQITATNGLHTVAGDALPEVLKCGQVLPSSVSVSGAGEETTLSDATFLPGRGGRLWAANDALGELQYCVPSEKVMRLPQGLKCACILRGKFCSPTSGHF